MNSSVPIRLANVVLNALKGGVVPRVGLEYITVGRADEISALLRDIEIVGDGGASFRFVVGKYGSGKSFLLQTIRNYAAQKGFAVADADLSPERRFAGSKGQGLATYKELMRNLSVKSKPDGGALPLILEKWITGIQFAVKTQTNADGDEFDKLVDKRIYEQAGSLTGMVNGFEFAKAVAAYWQAYRTGDDATKNNVLKWFRGECPSRKEAKDELGINFIVTDETWYDFLKVFAAFLVNAGYCGLYIIIDELVNIYKIPHSITRANNYEKILTMYNDALQGKASHIGFLLGGTPQCIEDRYKGIFSYEALRSRLDQGHFAKEGFKDITAPIIRLDMLSQEEMYVLLEKLLNIHAGLYNYTPSISHNELLYFLTVEYNRVGADTHITPREIIRDFIELINILYQHPETNTADILGSNSFELAKGGITDEQIHDDFAEFEV